jgi:cytochrome P450
MSYVKYTLLHTDRHSFRWPTFSDATMQALYHNLDNYVRLNLTGGAALADFYSILRYIPTFLSPAKREAHQHRSREIPFYTNLWLKAKSASLNNEKARRICVCDEVVKLQQQEGFSDEYASYIPSQLWEAGSDTTSTELYGFYHALLLYPEVPATGQAEIDRVIGSDRMPTLDDMDQLPYVRACVKETLRWLPTAVLGALPHATIADDVYEGYKIPKNSTVVLNVWAIHRDPARHYNPERFMPERYLGDNKSSQESSASIDVSKRDHFGFGSGRRICPGMNVADRTMLLGIARAFWAFDVKPKFDATGEPKLPVQDDFLQGFVVIPKYFEVAITLRSDEKAKIIKREWESAQNDLGQDGQFLQK